MKNFKEMRVGERREVASGRFSAKTKKTREFQIPGAIILLVSQSVSPFLGHGHCVLLCDSCLPYPALFFPPALLCCLGRSSLRGCHGSCRCSTLHAQGSETLFSFRRVRRAHAASRALLYSKGGQKKHHCQRRLAYALLVFPCLDPNCRDPE